jgi:hypothetical protein
MSKDDTELRCFGRKWYVYDGERSRIVAGPFLHPHAAREWKLLSQAPVDSVAPR